MEWSEERDKIAVAMVKIQAGLKTAAKDSTNPHFKSQYADLASCWEACRDALKENEVAVIQSPGMDERGLVMETEILHSSGQWCRGVIRIPLSPTATAQQVGSAITYARRYSLCAMVGICPDDDDGNGASGAPPKQQAKKPPPSKNPYGPIATRLRTEIMDKSLKIDNPEKAALWLSYFVSREVKTTGLAEIFSNEETCQAVVAQYEGMKKDGKTDAEIANLERTPF